MTLEMPDNFGDLPASEQSEWIAAMAIALELGVPADFNTLTPPEQMTWLEAGIADLDARMARRQKEMDDLTALIAYLEPVTRGRPKCTIGDALKIKAAEEQWGKPLRKLNLTELSRFILRAMIRSRVPSIEPEGGRERQSILFTGGLAEMRARGISADRAEKLVTRQSGAVLGEPAMLVYGEFYLRRGLEAMAESVATEMGIALAPEREGHA